MDASSEDERAHVSRCACTRFSRSMDTEWLADALPLLPGSVANYITSVGFAAYLRHPMPTVALS